MIKKKEKKVCEILKKLIKKEVKNKTLIDGMYEIQRNSYGELELKYIAKTLH